MEYRVIEASGIVSELEKAVNEHLQMGWQLQGGVAVGVSTSSHTWWYYQAMVRNRQLEAESS